MTFPELLMHIIDNEKESHGTIVWKDNGQTFWITTKEFNEKVLRIRFAGTKLESFTRKLNRWSFKRIHDQSLPCGTIAYRHPLFKKGHPELLKNMSGVKKKESLPNELRVLREENTVLSLPKLQLGQFAGLSQPQFSVSDSLTNDTLEHLLLRKQLLQLLGHSVTSPFQAPLTGQQEINCLNGSLQPNDTDDLVKRLLLQQQIAQLSTAQVAALQLAASSTAAPAASQALLRLRHYGFV